MILIRATTNCTPGPQGPGVFYEVSLQRNVVLNDGSLAMKENLARLALLVRGRDARSAVDPFKESVNEILIAIIL